MSPREYQRIRKEIIDCAASGSTSSTGNFVFEVDGKPYLPLLVVDPKDDESAYRAATAILSCSTGTTTTRPRTTHDDPSSEETAGSSATKYQVTPIEGGNTNTLLKVDLPVSSIDDSENSSSVKSVLVRIFGAEGMIDRDVENSTFAALSLQGLAPPYYGRFSNGRIEGWTEGMRPLKTSELSNPHVATHIARAMAELHCNFTIPPHLVEYHPRSPNLWKQLEEWYQQMLNSNFANQQDRDRVEELCISKFRNELDWLRNEVIVPSKIVFSHNDVLAGNVLYNEQTREIQLIDFEYGGMNFQAFDIANHFNEYAGGTDNGGRPNYEWFPSESQQRQFLKDYLEASTYDSSPHAVQELYDQVQSYLLVNHLYWSFWAINSASLEGCENFDYILYASLRLKEYWKSTSR